MRSPAHVSDKRLFKRTGVYLLANIPYIFKCKFGITEHVKARRSNVSETTKGFVFPVMYLRMNSGHNKERFIHALYFWANAPFSKGSGRSEWFWNVSPVMWILCVHYFPEAPMMYKAAVLITPLVWLDGLFFLLLFWVVDIAFWFAVATGIFWFVF